MTIMIVRDPSFVCGQVLRLVVIFIVVQQSLIPACLYGLWSCIIMSTLAVAAPMSFMPIIDVVYVCNIDVFIAISLTIVFVSHRRGLESYPRGHRQLEHGDLEHMI